METVENPVFVRNSEEKLSRESVENRCGFSTGFFRFPVILSFTPLFHRSFPVEMWKTGGYSFPLMFAVISLTTV